MLGWCSNLTYTLSSVISQGNPDQPSASSCGDNLNTHPYTHTHTRINLRLPHLVDGSTAGKSRRKPTVKRWKILILHTVEPDVELPLANGNATPAGSFPAVEWNKMTSK